MKNNFPDMVRATEKFGLYHIPSQEELQLLLKEDPVLKITCDLQILSKMRVQISKDYCSNYLKSCTISQMWLLFYMSYCHSKVWGTDGWIIKN